MDGMNCMLAVEAEGLRMYEKGKSEGYSTGYDDGFEAGKQAVFDWLQENSDIELDEELLAAI